MANETVKRVKLQIVDEFSRNLDKYQREIGQAANATDDLGKRGGLRQLNQDLGAIATKAAIGVAALTGFFKGADALSQVGQTALRSRASLDALTDSTADYEQKVRAVQAATRGLTTESEAAAIAARLQQFGLAETAGEMQAFVDTIVRVGAVNPMLGDTTEAISQIQLTLSNMSFMRLDQLGLSADKVRARMAELKAATRDMSNEAAFQQAVMEGLAQQAGRVSDEMLDIGGAQGRFKTLIREAGDDIGIYITGRLDQAANSVLMIRDILQEISVGEFAVKLAIEIADETGLINRTPGTQAMGATETFARAGFQLPPNIQNNLEYIFATERDPLGFLIEGGYIPADVIDRMGQRAMQQAGGMFRGTLGFGGSAIAEPTTMFNMQAVRARQLQIMSPQEIAQSMSSRGIDSASIAAAMNQVASVYDPTVLGAGGLVIDPRTIAGSRRDQGAAQSAIRRANAPTTGAGFEFMQAAQTGLGLARGELDEFGQTQLPGIVAGIQELAGSFADAAGAAGDFVTEAEAVGNLNEFFGVAPSGLDADIYTRAADALRNAEVEGEAYAEALRILGIETGVTNVANEVFNDQLDNLATALANGEITAAQYVEQIRLLQNTDWSKMQAFATSMDPEQAAEFATALGAVGGTETFDTAYDKISDIIGLLQGGGEGGEGEQDAMGPFGLVADQAQTFEDEQIDRNKRMTDDAAALWGNYTDTGTSAFATVQKESEAAFDAMRANLASMNFDIQVRTRLMMGGGGQSGDSSAATPGGSSMPEFASGGHTGAGTGAFLAWLHEDEWVINQDMRRSLAHGGGIQGAQMTTAGLQQGRLEADTPIVIQIGEDELARVNARHAYRTNARGAVPSNG